MVCTVTFASAKVKGWLKKILQVTAMLITDKHIDNGKSFDWGRTSADYAKFRDIYPPEFYERIAKSGLCVKGQRVLDLGTGTGVLPRNMLHFGAKWVGTDISENQIAMARKLSKGTDIEYIVSPSESLKLSDGSFDVITACQCFWYFDHEKLEPKLFRLLKDGGRILVLYMAFLPYEDEIAGESEKLVLKFNPDWSGKGETMHPIEIPPCYVKHFELIRHEEYKLKVHFTRESWNGRMKACRGIGASLPDEEVKRWENDHIKMLSEKFPEEFDVLHYAAMAELKKI